jgi:predicted naringenin-chalcone synthase
MPNDVSWHAEPLAAAIGEAPERVQRLLLRNPAALALTASQLADGSLSLASATGLQPIQALAMLVKRPLLLQLQPEVRRASAWALGCPKHSCNRRCNDRAMLHKPIPTPSLTSQDVASRMSGVAAAMGMAEGDAAPLIARQPVLLEVSPESLAPQASRLAAALEVTLPGLLLMLSRATPPTVRSLLSTPAQVCDPACHSRLHGCHCCQLSVGTMAPSPWQL